MKQHFAKMILLILVFTLHLKAQINVNREWQTNSGSPLINPLVNPAGVDWSSSITNSGGDIITTAHTNVSGQGENMYLEKRDPSGTPIFTVSVNTSGTQNDFGIALCTDASNNIYVIGTTDNGGTSNYDVRVWIFNTSGTLMNTLSYAGPSGLNDIGTDIKLDPSGNILIACSSENTSTTYDYRVIKYNSGGSLLWNSTYDYASLIDVPVALDVSGSTVVVAGASASMLTRWEYCVASFNLSTGAYISDTRTTISGVGYTKPLDFKKDASQNIYLTGKSSTNGIDYDMLTVKINSGLTIDWMQSFDFAGGEDLGNSIDVDASGNVIVGGYSTKSNNTRQLSVLKYSSTGTLLWQHHQSAEDMSGDAYIKMLCVNPGNEIYFTGGEKGLSGYQQVLTGRLNVNGTGKWIKKISDSNDNTPSSIVLNTDGTIEVTSLKDAATPFYQTTKYSEFEADATASYNGRGNPVCRKQELIVGFWPNAINKTNVDNLAGTRIMDFGSLSDFLTTTASGSVSAALATVCRSCDIKVSRIYKNMKTTDTISVLQPGDTIPMPDFWASLLLHFPTGISLSQAMSAMNSLPTIVAYAHPNYIILPFSPPNDSLYSLQKSLHTTPPATPVDINVEEAWTIYPTGGNDSINCGVFDTGIDWSHPDFGYNGTFGSSKVSGYDLNTSNDMRYTAIADSNGHGTGVSGIIAAIRNNTIGVAGIAGGNGASGNQGVSLVSCNIAGYTLADAANGLADMTIGTTFLNAVNLSNNSWGTDSINSLGNLSSGYTLFTETLHNYFRHHKTFIAARGNYGNDMYIMPSCADSTWVISVSATGSDGQFKDNSVEETYWGSCYGKGVDVAAPGVLSLVHTTGPMYYNPYMAFHETSCATPHVTGATALLMGYMRSLSPHVFLDPEDCEFIISRSATDIGAIGWDQYTGYGRLNVGKALRMVEHPYRHLYQFDAGNTSFSHNVSVYSNNDTIQLVERYKSNAIPSIMYQAGNYIVKTFKVDITANHGLNFPTDSIMYVWPRHSSSIGLGLFDAQKKLIAHERLLVNSCNQTSASLSFYAYEVKNMLGSPLGWWPCDTSLASVFLNQKIFAYSVLTKNTAVGLKEKSSINQKVSLFPNPANQQQTLVIENDQASQCTVELYDMMGRYLKTVYKGKIGPGKTNITNDVEKLPNSMYLYIIQLDDTRFSRKFIKQQ